MDENTTTVEQQSADQQDAFLTGWDGDDVTTETEEAADQQAEQAEEQEQEANEEGSETEGQDPDNRSEQTSESKPETKPEGAEEAENPADTVWTIKHMGEEKTLRVGDITPALLQKGLDYDRVREKYDEAKPIVEMFAGFAQKAGMSVGDYAKYIRAEAKKASGMSEDEAKRTVELEDREAAIAAKETAAQEIRHEKEKENQSIQTDLTNFAAAFPEVYKQAQANPKIIPQSVWDDVNSGKMSLTAAYSKYAIAKANEQVAAANRKADAAGQQQKNAARSTGSMKSAGNDTKNTDPFLEGWGD